MFVVLDRDKVPVTQVQTDGDEGWFEQNTLEAPVYKGGETVKGTLYFELQQPSIQTDIYVRLQGHMQAPDDLRTIHQSSDMKVPIESQGEAERLSTIKS